MDVIFLDPPAPFNDNGLMKIPLALVPGILLACPLCSADTPTPPTADRGVSIPGLADVPRSSDAQQRAIADISRRMILSTSRALFVAQGIADSLDGNAPTWETVQNDVIQAVLNSPEAAGLPDAFTDSLRRKVRLNDLVVSTLAAGGDSDRKLADLVTAKVREQDDFHNAYVQRETGISLPALTLQLNSFLEIALQETELHFGDYPRLIELDEQFTREQDEDNPDAARRTLAAMLGSMFDLAAKSLDSPLEATPEERTAILRYCDQSFIQLALAQIRHPEQWTDTAAQMAALNALPLDESSLPVDLQVLLNKERKIRHDIIALARQEPLDDDDAQNNSALDARFDELDAIQQKIGDYTRRMVGMTPMQAHNLAHQKLMLRIGDKIEASLRELGLADGKASCADYLKKLSPPDLQQLQTIAFRVLLEDWERNGIPE